MKTRHSARKTGPESASTRAEEETTASEDQGAEVASAAQRPTVADDYEASARLDDEGSRIGDDFDDDQFTADRPDTAVILAEELAERDQEACRAPLPRKFPATLGR